jgi:hypothetical protein
LGIAESFLKRVKLRIFYGVRQGISLPGVFALFLRKSGTRHCRCHGIINSQKPVLLSAGQERGQHPPAGQWDRQHLAGRAAERPFREKAEVSL